MFLKELQLYQFKNHTESKFSFTEPVNCFVGDNGAGKTNILDAIHYLSQTKSYFNHIDKQNIQFEQNYFMLKGIFEKDQDITEIKCKFKQGETMNIKKDKKKYKRFSEHIGRFPVIIISPTDTNLIIEDSEVRRKYIDSSIAQYKQSYLQMLIQYKKNLKQRNALLKQFVEKGYFDKDYDFKCLINIYCYQTIPKINNRGHYLNISNSPNNIFNVHECENSHIRSLTLHITETLLIDCLSKIHSWNTAITSSSVLMYRKPNIFNPKDEQIFNFLTI